MSEADRLQTFTIVEASQEGDDPATIEVIMPSVALRFRDEPGYQPEWLPRG